ncbi:hypothetical protein BC834DRAFT_642330 [Gloeopeniophorella convolvens]|nr:hypothetical protein BC834DRAFT_642330 [Gloeopeniophorella convolvens]
MSRLETLHLASCLPKEPAPTDRPAIELPHLKSLLLSDNVDRCADVLQYLRVPNACLSIIVPLTKEDSSPWDDDQSILIPALQRHLLAANASIRSTNVLMISFSIGTPHQLPYNRVVMTMDPSPEDWNVGRKLEILDDPRNETHLPLYLSHPIRLQDYPPHSVELCVNLPLPAIRTLALDLLLETWDLDLWTSVSQNLPAVEDLMLTGRLILSFLRTCTAQAFGGWERLQSLCLGSMEYYLRGTPGGEEVFVQALLGWLRAYQIASLRPPVIRLSSVVGYSDMSWVEQARAYTQVEIYAPNPDRRLYFPSCDSLERRVRPYLVLSTFLTLF